MSSVPAISTRAPSVFEVVARRAFERPPSALIRDELADAIVAESEVKAQLEEEARRRGRHSGAGGQAGASGTVAATAALSGAAGAARMAETAPAAAPVAISVPAPGHKLDVRV